MPRGSRKTWWEGDGDQDRELFTGNPLDPFDPKRLGYCFRTYEPSGSSSRVGFVATGWEGYVEAEPKAIRVAKTKRLPECKKAVAAEVKAK